VKKLNIKAALVRTNLKMAIEVRAGSQLAFAKAAGIHPVRLNRIVKGWIEPSPAERARFVELLKVDATWLFRIVTLPTAPAATTAETTLTEISAQIDGMIRTIETASETEKD